MANVGDRVYLVAGGVSVFEVLDIDGEHALVQSVQEAPGKYPFRTIVSYLVPAEEP
ncbi:hypothetical protein [Nocardia cyriacigeorgica]|uniref:hypothetical protein n=1 Tax=Nocardia cyriacigeorgica TaxID=135487 RepID=UPI0015E2C176|nr:hypothetical protein [Nocardia cyriacigeorgica]